MINNLNALGSHLLECIIIQTYKIDVFNLIIYSKKLFFYKLGIFFFGRSSHIRLNFNKISGVFTFLRNSTVSLDILVKFDMVENEIRCFSKHKN